MRDRVSGELDALVAGGIEGKAMISSISANILDNP